MGQTTRRTFLRGVAGTLIAKWAMAQTAPMSGPGGGHAAEVKVGVYYFPQWHVDPLNEKLFGKGWTEWESVRKAKPKFAGHQQPKVPLWGYEDESDSAVMAKKIDAAADHGVDFLIFDWYWNMFTGPGPFLHRCLENGYLKAPNNARVKFCCMWANHLPVERKVFDEATRHAIEAYFSHPSHFRISGRPYLSIYEIDTLVTGLKGIEATRDALADFRRRAKAACGVEPHLNVIDHQPRHKPDPAGYVKQFGFDSVTSYVWIHMVPLTFPTMDYDAVKARYLVYAEKAERMYGVPYYPNVSMGWDSTPRMPQDQPHDNRGYPNTAVITGNTPERFEAALRDVKERAMRLPEAQRIVTINSWNEWTEGSYIEPDTVNGMGYLEAIRRIVAN